MNRELMNAVTEIANGVFDQYLAEPLEVLDGNTRVGSLKTGAAANSYLRFGIECNSDDRLVKLTGGTVRPLDPVKAALFILRQFSRSNGFAGVALHQSANGSMTVHQAYDVAGDRDFTASAQVLTKLLERAIASTAYLAAIGLFANLCDSGLKEDLARGIVRDAFEMYMPLFEQYGVAAFFESDTDGVDE